MTLSAKGIGLRARLESLASRLRPAPGVPKITHQTGAARALDPDPAQWRARLLALNPDWEHRFYADADCRDAIGRHCPALLPIYDAYPTAVQRADMFRVVVVYGCGGVYLDLDVECLAPLDPLTRLNCALAEEKTLSEARAAELGHAQRLRIANYMFGAAPRHPFWLDVLAAMVERAGRPVRDDDDILETTGPGLFSTIFADTRRRDIALLPHPDVLCPSCGQPSCQFGPYARHWHRGSWRGGAGAPAPVAAADLARARRAIAAQRGGLSAWVARKRL